MKTFGIPTTQELISLLPLDDESYSPTQLCPRDKYWQEDPRAPWNQQDHNLNSADYPELLWLTPVVVPLIKLSKPFFNEATHKCEPLLVWFEDRVERDWTVTELTSQELKAKVPPNITVRQLREWLILNNLFDTVEITLQSISNPIEQAIALNWWNYATEYQRHHPLVETLGAALGMSSEQIDTAWIEASAR